MPQNFIEQIQSLKKFSSEISILNCMHFNTVILSAFSELECGFYAVANMGHCIIFNTSYLKRYSTGRQ
ncbi:hypothetical protein GCM10011396_31480 [Undibacterium terreum]|uniref:Uncharacterized protein n=1 Tax=Undibacterium terreum TaxID=1224302 RepID=A0A916UPD3_9BURK|nr:hypothetical protein GCM10011396_31480 [Undibacterium terreum]